MRIFPLILLLCRPIDAFQGFHHEQLFHRSPQSATSTSIEEPVETCTFHSPEMKVFIEDTDAYGIMYNGNYLRSYDRALHLSSINNDAEAAATTTTTTTRRVTTHHEGWSIVSMGNQKFLSSPALGSNFVVQGSLKDSSEDLEVWDLKMTSPDGDTVFNTVQDLKIARPLTDGDGNKFSLPRIEPISFDDGVVVQGTTDTFTVYRDEIDAHWTGHLPLRNVLNLFERSRTNIVGGPDDLRRLQTDHGILIVVASIGDCSLIDENTTINPGQSVSVETSYVVKRKGMIVDCYQTLKSDDDYRLAQGRVTLMMINTETYRPTSKLPDWVKQKIGLL